ncbi:hypothetical protein [Allocoleopsis franciscana]|uniref:Uncharacterized protein n=1 Tax=Allocoleopsis franciscana PCC 7113 TaxID=1173027 RepID=K9WQ17_9CYAN|nr:hypothetical protein Mic7113_6300 [Allocoleopsis franciscana PCC 7113]
MLLEESPVDTEKKLPQPEVDVEGDNYDRGIVPAETAARKDREGADFKKNPQDDRPETHGFTVDKEGLIDNFAIEPEMYVNEPGDLRAKEEELEAERLEEFEEINEDKDGDLTMDADRRGKGPGII